MPPHPALPGRLPERVARRITAQALRAAALLTSPLTPDDYLGLLDPLLDARHPAGRVAAVRAETDDATTLFIRPGRGWSGHLAGQYLPVGVELDGAWHWRTYSLTSPPGSGTLSVTVKAQPGGRVSPHLAHRVRPGAVLRLGPAQGDFTLPPPNGPGARLLFLTAGSGITPVMGLLRTLMGRRPAADRPDVVLLHSAPDAASCLFRTELRLARARSEWLRYHERHTRTAGRVTPEDLERLCPDWRRRETWACGPAALLDAVEEHWARAGLAHALHVERFRLTPPLPARPLAAVGGTVRFTRTGVETATDGVEPLLAAGERAGVAMPYGCRRGICFGCLTPLAYGRARDLRTGQIHDEPGRMLQTCVTGAVGPLGLDV